MAKVMEVVQGAVAMVVVLRKSRLSSNTSSKLYEKNVLL